MDKVKEDTPKVIKKPKVNHKGGKHVTSEDIVTGMGYSSGTYYPAGSALLKEEDRTFESYKNLFADEISADKLSEIESLENKADAKKHFEEEFEKYCSAITKHSVTEKILHTAIILMVFSIPLVIFIVPTIMNTGLGSINYGMLIIYYGILALIAYVTYKLAKDLVSEIKDLELALDFTKHWSDTLRE